MGAFSGTGFRFMRWTGMTRLASTVLTGMLALGNAHANAQAGATPPTARNEIAQPAAQPPTADDICRTLEQAAAENALPVEFFVRVIWQESRFDARAVSSKGAKGIAQFMPHTADEHGLGDPFNPIQALRHSAAYLRELRERFGNLGLAAAAYNAGPGRVSAWLINHRKHRDHRPLPGETRNYVAIVTGRTADEWASPSSPQRADTTIPQGVPCTLLANLVLAPRAAPPSPSQTADSTIPQGVANLLLAPRAASPSPPRTPDPTIPQGIANLVLAPRAASPLPPETADTAVPQSVANLVLAARAEATHIASHLPRWGVWLAAALSESKAWALYGERLTRFASLIGDREPIVLFRQLPGMGSAKRYIIAIADDDRAPLDKFCEKLTTADFTCNVMRNEVGPSALEGIGDRSLPSHSTL
jgi:hypothetical protein